MKRTSLQILFLFLLLIPSQVVGQQQATVQPVALEQALQIAPEEGKKILVDVFASWCP